MYIGDVRVNAVDQNTLGQLAGLVSYNMFTDKFSHKDVNRPQLELLLSFVTEGDTLVCNSLDLLGLSVMNAFAQYDHELIRERQQEDLS